MALRYELIANGTGLAFPPRGVVGNKFPPNHPDFLEIPSAGIRLLDNLTGRGGVVICPDHDRKNFKQVRIPPGVNKVIYGYGVHYRVEGMTKTSFYFIENP